MNTACITLPGALNIAKLKIQLTDASPADSCLLPPTKEEVNVFARVRLSVCLSVSKITPKRVHGLG